MFRRNLLTFLVISAGMFGLQVSPASALTAPPQLAVQHDGNTRLFVLVQERRARDDRNRAERRCVEPNCQDQQAGDRSRKSDRANRDRGARNDGARIKRDNRGRADRNDRARNNRDNRDRVIRDNDRRNNFRNRTNVFVYNRNFHGPRCQTRFGNCRHFYRGYYYSSPWWSLPYAGTSIIVGSPGYAYHNHRNRDYSIRHIDWCEDHYRSYDVGTNTWVSYSGEVRQCISPYF